MRSLEALVGLSRTLGPFAVTFEGGKPAEVRGFRRFAPLILELVQEGLAELEEVSVREVLDLLVSPKGVQVRVRRR